MGTITRGSELGAFIVTGITVAQSKKENRDGVKSKFVILQLVDEDAPCSKPMRHAIFEEDLPQGIISTLLKYKAEQKDEKGGHPINLPALKASEEFNDPNNFVSKLTRFVGGMKTFYDMGCERYANNIDDEQIYLKDGKTKVTARKIPVFVWIKNIMTDDEGKSVTNYYSGFELETQGRRLMNTFYKKPVEAAPVAEPKQDDGKSDDDVF